MTKRIIIDIGKVLAVLAILALLIFLAYIGSDWLLILFALALIGAAALMVFYVRRAVVRGELPGRFGGRTFRHSSPFNFWFQVVIYILAAGSWFFFGLALVGLAPHWFIALLRSMHSHR